jgi:hypothetical protein
MGGDCGCTTAGVELEKQLGEDVRSMPSDGSL